MRLMVGRAPFGSFRVGLTSGPPYGRTGGLRTGFPRVPLASFHPGFPVESRHVFRRTKTAESSSASTTVTKEGGKGRPTPTRKEAEAAARARAQAVQGKAKAGKAGRQQRAVSSAAMREGMRNGVEEFLPPRDKGPRRRFIRDFVDARLNMAEFLLPIVFVMLLTSGVNPRFSNGLSMATFVVVGLDTVWMTRRLKRGLKATFPEDNLKGDSTYAVVRTLQLRWLRLPKPQVKVGGAPKPPSTKKK